MDKNYFIIETYLDPTEDASYSLINEDGENQATVVIKDGKVNIYFEDGRIEEFEDDFSKMLDRVKKMNLKFMKLQNGAHRWKKYNPNPKSCNIDDRALDCALRFISRGIVI